MQVRNVLSTVHLSTVDALLSVNLSVIFFDKLLSL